ncbi:hypothetical protein BIV57_11675 [Mangrovactinospora gilvigrisea]|uniref:Uncharacterized protein n=1 Tax=Mangrovactinospora gilvigrisea TaxID=1428644 RepID=A0A1J7BF23_9ACTN|nr:hypothetical protein [Mangrovactinospora gilvigrisea]OIV37303.1 hypothetical protein BIV57_11675 [Mangrovactinospora gilvigrisea]
MDNFRSPVGPLPSSIYWRRRIVVLSVLLLVAALVVWGLLSGGSGGKDGASGPPGRKPTASITPGPTPTGSAITTEPGGGGGSGSGASPSPSGTAGAGSPSPLPSNHSGWNGGSGAGGSSGSSGSTGNGGSGAQAGMGGSGAQDVASWTSCSSAQVTLSLRPYLAAGPAQDRFGPDTRARFLLKAVNAGGQACKIDLTPHVTVTAKNGSTVLWDSARCAATRQTLLLGVGADATVQQLFQWAKLQSDGSQCDPAQLGRVPGGDYTVKMSLAGFGTVSTDFTLKW